MRVYLSILFFIFSYSLWADNEIVLADSACKIVSSNTMKLKVADGSLTRAVCNKKDNSITCAISTEDGTTMYGEKPYVINNYTEFAISDFLFWNATDYEGLFVLNLPLRKYSSTSIQLMGGHVINKHCVGDILHY